MKKFKIRDKFKIPGENKGCCGHKGRVVWISENEKNIVVECTEYHEKDYNARSDTKSRITPKPFLEPYKGKKGVKYLIDVSDLV
jgi:hypothetical protein